MEKNKVKNKKLTLADFFGGYFENIGKMTLVNIMFCIPLAFYIAIMFLLNNFGINNIFVIFLAIPFLSPFFAGLFYVSRKVTMDEELKPLKDFLKGIKENMLYFLINSVIIYIVVIGLVLTFSFYRTGLNDSMMIASFVMTLFFTLFFLFFENSFLTMTVTVELKCGDIIKNSVLLVLKGLGGHIKTILSFAFMSVIIYSVFMFAGNIYFRMGIILILTLLFLPIMCSYIVVFNSYKTLKKHIIDPFIEEQNYQNEISENINSLDEELYAADIEKLETLSKGDENEFVFLNGKMIKRKTIINMLDKYKS